MNDLGVNSTESEKQPNESDGLEVKPRSLTLDKAEKLYDEDNIHKNSTSQSDLQYQNEENFPFSNGNTLNDKALFNNLAFHTKDDLRKPNDSKTTAFRIRTNNGNVTVNQSQLQQQHLQRISPAKYLQGNQYRGRVIGHVFSLIIVYV